MGSGRKEPRGCPQRCRAEQPQRGSRPEPVPEPGGESPTQGRGLRGLQITRAREPQLPVLGGWERPACLPATRCSREASPHLPCWVAACASWKAAAWLFQLRTRGGFPLPQKIINGGERPSRCLGNKTTGGGGFLQCSTTNLVECTSCRSCPPSILQQGCLATSRPLPFPKRASRPLMARRGVRSPRPDHFLQSQGVGEGEGDPLSGGGKRREAFWGPKNPAISHDEARGMVGQN